MSYEAGSSLYDNIMDCYQIDLGQTMQRNDYIPRGQIGYSNHNMDNSHSAFPSPPTSPTAHYSWQVTTVDENDHTHVINDECAKMASRRTQIPADTMASFMSGPDPTDGKYICLYGGCMKRFGRKYNIQSHIQTHLADRPYRCNTCQAGFVRRHDLVRHSRIHANNKEHVCDCGKGFSRMDALSRHKNRQICRGGQDKWSLDATARNRTQHVRSHPDGRSDHLAVYQLSPREEPQFLDPSYISPPISSDVSFYHEEDLS